MVKVSDMWQETCLIALTKKGGTDVDFAAKSDDLSFGGAERDIDLKTMLNGSNKVVLKPMTIQEVTMKIYAVEADEVDNLFMGVEDAIQPLSITNVLNRYEFRFAMLLTDKTTAVSATEEIAGSKAGYRRSAIGGFMTKCEPFWEGTEYGLNVTLKFPPYKSGAAEPVGNLTVDSTDGTATMTALAAYS